MSDPEDWDARFTSLRVAVLLAARALANLADVARTLARRIYDEILPRVARLERRELARALARAAHAARRQGG